MATFKKGDVVERIKGNHNGMRVGQRDVVKQCDDNDHAMILENHGTGHAPKSFKLVTNEESKGLTSADIEFVPGDKFELIKGYKCVSAGREVTLRTSLNEWRTTLVTWAGNFKRDNLKLIEQSSEHLHKLRGNHEFDDLAKGDKVAIVDFGWGIGGHAHVKIGDVGTVLRDFDNDGRVHADFGGEYSNTKVSRVCLRKVITDTVGTAEEKPKPTKATPKDPVGILTVHPKWPQLVKPDSIRTQQLHAQKVLRPLKKCIDGPVYICGGAPRNWDHDKMANDIDVYFYLSGSKASFMKKQIASYLQIPESSLIKLGANCDDAYYGLNGIKFVFQSKIAGQLYQFIVMETPMESDVLDSTDTDDVDHWVLKNFNCDLCRIAYNPFSEEYHKTTEYKTDKEFKRLTYRMYLLEEANARGSLERHVPKLMKQFPEHTVVIMQKDPSE